MGAEVPAVSEEAVEAPKWSQWAPGKSGHYWMRGLSGLPIVVYLDRSPDRLEQVWINGEPRAIACNLLCGRSGSPLPRHEQPEWWPVPIQEPP